MLVVDPMENLEGGTRTKPFCMILHPKTGSQATREALRQTFGARVVRGQHFFDEEECNRIVNEGGIVCSTVRNPWDLMISWYFYSEKRPAGNGQFPKCREFPEWLDATLKGGNGWIEKGLFYGVDFCNRIIRFEHGVEDQLNNCLRDCGLTPVKMRRVADTGHSHYSHYYDIPSAIKVAQYCSPEILEWQYEFEVL